VNVIRMISSPMMLKFMPFCLWTAISLSYFQGALVKVLT